LHNELGLPLSSSPGGERNHPDGILLPTGRKGGGFGAFDY